MTAARVLVTGGSGFIAGHCILGLLDAGYVVRATVRSLAREGQVRAVLERAGMTRGDALDFVAADLLDDAGWAEALDGVDGLLHVASPVMPGHVDDEDAVIRPAREGALRVLRFARDAGVRRVVLTSAFHAVGWGHPRDGRVFTEKDWTVLDGPGSDAYARAKTLSERAAWDFVADGGGPELVTILPVAVMGPVLGGDVSGANHLVEAMLTGAMRATPDIRIPIVDVRDVAAAHVAALTAPDAAGERLLLSHGPPLSLAAIAAVLRSRLGPAAAKVPTRSMPNLVVRIAALVNPQAKAAAPDLGYARLVSSDKARRIIGWHPRPAEDAIVAAGESMVTRTV